MTKPFVPEMYAIDFGTSNSLLAAANRDATHPPIPLDEHALDPSVFRSILYFSDDLAWSFGAGALSDYVAQGLRGRFIRSVKRFLPMQSFADTRIGTRKVTLEELVGMFLREMRRRANQYFERDVRRVMLGRPARFSDDDQADQLAEARLRRAAEFAGFEDIHFCPEPLAAAYDFGTTKPGAHTFLVADFGGGTSDFTVARLDPTRQSSLEVLAIGGVAQAGDAFDGSLMRHGIAEHFGSRVRYQVPFGSNWLEMPAPLMERLCSPAEICLLARRDVLDFLRGVRSGSAKDDDKRRVDQLTTLIEDGLGFQLFEAIEQEKRELSAQAAATFHFEYPGIDIQESFTRERFEQASARVSSAILNRLDEVLERAGLSPSDIERVCSTGGTAKVPIINRGLEARFGAHKLQALSSFHAVIQGLAERARLTLNQE
ncbi:MAG TPA: Hsp70 family protein [Polyangiaceae bacterium]|nr:Hsp70 family protein [Polyangiaceae bacterium]